METHFQEQKCPTKWPLTSLTYLPLLYKVQMPPTVLQEEKTIMDLTEFIQKLQISNHNKWRKKTGNVKNDSNPIHTLDTKLHIKYALYAGKFSNIPPLLNTFHIDWP